MSTHNGSASVLRFVSRAEQLQLRGQRNFSRYMRITKGSWTLTVPSALSGRGTPLRTPCGMRSGTNVMALSRVARAFSLGESETTLVCR